MTSAQKSVYSINDGEATAPLNESYDATDAEAKAPLNEQAQVAVPSETKEPRCSTRKKLLGAGVFALAIAAGALGYYFGFYRKDTSRPKYTYKRVIPSNSTSSQVKPLSLSTSNDQQCTVYQGNESTTYNVVPMPHQLVLCQG